MLWIASMVVIANTIRLAIFARRKEIGIMKLVGATNWFIRWPFLVEGIIQGILGVVLALFLLWAFDAFVFQGLFESIKWLKFDTSILSITELTAILSVAGMAIGAFGSLVALRRFLRV
jgi:cell division transport system permease protein